MREVETLYKSPGPPKHIRRSAHERDGIVRSVFATVAHTAKLVKQKLIKILKKFFS